MCTIVIEALTPLDRISCIKMYKNNARSRLFCRIAKRSIIENNIKNIKKTKLWFLKGSKFGMKEYIGCEEASSLLKLKLNMVDLRANYKGKYTDSDSLCRRCGSHEEHIEHLWDCPNFIKTQDEKRLVKMQINPKF